MMCHFFTKRIRFLRLFGLVVLTGLITSINVTAQEMTVTGTVISTSDELPMAGVNVVIEGTTIGTVTNLDGEYEIAAQVGAQLNFSFLGFLTESVTVGDESVVNIHLAEDLTSLDEIVVIGYGTQKKKLVTGATAQVNGDVLEERNATSAMQALQGQAAGVNITSSSGQPGEGMKVSIRGVGTIADASPLYIVDGLIADDIDFLNPADIESIDVLKDAASAAIYGSRAANGVILVTTKQGQAGRSQVTFDAYYGVQNVANQIRMLNTDEYVEIMNEQHLNSGNSAATLPFKASDLPEYTENGVASTDWIDEMFVKNALTQNYVIGANGGNEQSVYSASLSYTGQEGIVGGRNYSNYKRYGVRLNSEHKMYNNHVKIGEHLTFSSINQNGVSVGNQYDNALRSAFNASPLLPVYDDNGDFFNSASDEIVDQNGETYWNDTESNPYAAMVYGSQNLTKKQQLIGDIYAEIEIIPNLTFRSSYGINYYNEQYRSYTPIYELSIYDFSTYNSATQKMATTLGQKWDNLLRYDFTMGSHRFETMLGASLERNTGEWMLTTNADVAFDDLDHAYIDNTTNQEYAKMTLEGAPDDETRMMSYFGRVQYNYNEKYMLNAVLRADGSSIFAEGNRWGYFPSFSGGWVVSSEDFMSSTSNAVQFLKLRASWGTNGSNTATAFQYAAPIAFTQATYPFGDTEGVTENGSYPERLSNEDIKWETSEQLNFGFDARILDRHMSVNFDWYRKVTKDWLILAPILATAGADAPYINGGNVTNTGVELALSYNNDWGDLHYSVSANGAYNKNNVTEVPTDDGIIHGATNTLYNNSEEFYRAETDHPIGYFWGYETDGLFQNTSEVNSYTNSEGEIIQPKADPGDVRYVDQNDDGDIDEEDKIELGDPNPDFMYGLSISLSYKAIDFSFVGNGVAGNQIVQSYRSQTGKFSNYTTDIMDRWTGEGTSNKIPRVTNSNINYQFSDLYIQNGSYFRLSNITLGVDIDELIDVKFFSQFRFYAQVQNLYTFTKYTGMDPEVGYGFDNGDEDKFSSGIDLGYYPRPRVYLLGVNVKF